jgi:hypothetical protein
MECDKLSQLLVSWNKANEQLSDRIMKGQKIMNCPINKVDDLDHAISERKIVDYKRNTTWTATGGWSSKLGEKSTSPRKGTVYHPTFVESGHQLETDLLYH